MRFSERIGAKPLRDVVQVTSMDDNLRNSLWNLLLPWVQGRKGQGHLWWEAAVAIARDFTKQPVDELPPNNQYDLHGWVKEIFFESKWFEVYDLIEFMVDNVPLGWPPKLLREAVNEILEREASGYRFVAGSLAPISSEVELEAIDGAVAAADDQGLSAVSGHIRTAVASSGNGPMPTTGTPSKKRPPRWSPPRSWSLGSNAEA